MHGFENNLFQQLIRLKEKYCLKGIKAEFEAEGSSFRDVMRLRILTARLGIGLFLKIGGVEALRDIKDSLEIGVDGLIAPMVESKFGVKKFLDAYQKVYKKTRIHLCLNIETKNALSQIDGILGYAEGKIDAITIGRTDLSGSYFNENIHPDSLQMLSLLEYAGKNIRKHGMEATVGGSLSAKSIELFKRHKKIVTLFHKFETRKVIMPSLVMIQNESAIREALKFEELYILSKKEIADLHIESEIARLTQLERRS